MSYIEREPLLEILNGLYEQHLTMHNYSADSATQDCIEAVIEAPAADVVEVVRCKDCKYYIRPDRGYPYCEIMSNTGEGEYYTPSDDHYCSEGERSE